MSWRAACEVVSGANVADDANDDAATKRDTDVASLSANLAAGLSAGP